ncbi:adenylate/guanylate cyclase domain-containing protein [Mycobacterium sp. E740]|uniref:adenylate/guanylate cyclase domain-containing protein n=1 Tax=Mycobacterium sp. E740 TaxID=1834149 RepID=UPI0007FCE322|nr:adenylate/guanylate cyclase domain-containing protein [Mycobacterium sp. E740]OBI74170.1 cyclase [Mycobacterium sp. E740]
MSDGPARSVNGGAQFGSDTPIDELLDEAVAAINRGDRTTAAELAGRVLAADSMNAEAEDLLAAPADPGEIRRLTIFFADLVDSTVLSTRVEPETYRLLVGRYREQVLNAVRRYEGYIGNTAGDGLLAVFGYPIAHENDVCRAVYAGLEIVREVERLSEQAQRRYGFGIGVRVGVHRGLVYLDTAQGDVYGLAANLAARVSGLAGPGTVVVSDAVEALIRNDFEMTACPASLVKGVADPVVHYHVVAERRERRTTGTGPLVGRARELAEIEKCTALAKVGALTTPGLILVGEAGIGKSRLAAAAVETAQASGAAVVELIGSPFHTDAGLYPIRTLIEHQCRIERNTGQAQRLHALASHLAVLGLDAPSLVLLLAPVLGLAADAGYEPVPAEGRKLYELILEAITTYLRVHLGDGSGLVVAEDVHWFDPASREVLAAMLDASDGTLLVVMTARQDGAVDQLPRCAVLEIGPLTDGESDALVSTLNGDLDTDQRAQVVARGDGVPFYIEQIVKGTSQTGVPETLYEPLFARLRASPTVVRVVEAAAVIGRHVDRQLLYSVVELSDREIDEIVSELEVAGVLERRDLDGWRFRHELLREVAAELAPPTVRRALHAKVADAMTRGSEPDWLRVADHYEEADRFDDAAAAYRRACDTARLRGALGEAITCLTRGLAQLERATSGIDRDRREAGLRLGRGLLNLVAEGYQSRDAATDLERCLRLSGTLTDNDLYLTLVALANYYLVRADLRRAAQVIEALRDGFGQQRWPRAGIDSLEGALAHMRGDLSAAAAALDRATSGARDSGRRSVDNEMHAIYRGVVALMRADLRAAETRLEESARAADAAGFPDGPYLHAFTRSMETWLHMEAGQIARARLSAADLSTDAELHGFDMWLPVGATWQAALRALTAIGAAPVDLDAHIASVTRSLASMRAMGAEIYTTIFDGILGRLLIAAGQPEAARERLDFGLNRAYETGMHFYDAELLRLRAQAAAGSQERRADTVKARELARRQGATLFELRVALDELDFGGRAAADALGSVVDLIPAGAMWPELVRARAALAEPAYDTHAVTTPRDAD